MSKIGVFDSGFGGLTVLSEIRAALPDYSYLYLGDSGRAPYGSRPQVEIYQYTKEAVQFLFEQDCSLVVLACNTASAEALRKIQQEFLPQKYPDRRVLGVIIPVAEDVAHRKIERVGVVATEGTVNSGAYIREIQKLHSDAKVYQEAAPRLVPLIESGEAHSKELRKFAHNYVRPLLKARVEAIILGCTHYAIIEDEFREIVPTEVSIINQSKVVADSLADYLSRHSAMEAQLEKGGPTRYYCTGDASIFTELSNKLLGLKITEIDQIKLGGSGE